MVHLIALLNTFILLLDPYVIWRLYRLVMLLKCAKTRWTAILFVQIRKLRKILERVKVKCGIEVLNHMHILKPHHKIKNAENK